MFKRLPDDSRAIVRLTIAGQPVEARAGDSVAAAMLAAGLLPARTTPVSETGRAPYCMMGVCFDCLMVIDGVASRQACMVTVRDGMKVEPQHGARRIPGQSR